MFMYKSGANTQKMQLVCRTEGKHVPPIFRGSNL